MNPVNFAVNKRSYCPDAPKTGSYFKKNKLGMIDGPNKMHVHQGWPLFYENQVIGKAIYAINTESISSD